jgi:hypothetical protein
MSDLTCLHPSCLESAAGDPDAPPEVSERALRLAEIARTVGDPTRNEEEENRA